MGDLHIGDLAVCVSKAHREQAGIGLEVGLYVVDRRRDGLVFFAGLDRSAWIPKTCLAAIDPVDPRVVAPPAWVQGVHRAARLVGATDLELDRDDPATVEIRLGCPGLDAVVFDDLRALLGGQAGSLRIQPGGMSRLIVAFRAVLPPARLTGPASGPM